MRRMTPLLILALALALPACRPQPRELATLTGKAAYGEMALEGARVEAAPLDGSPAFATTSGYHGDFRLDLPPGRYRLTGSFTLRRSTGDLPLTGSIGIALPPGRTNRVLLPLSPP